MWSVNTWTLFQDKKFNDLVSIICNARYRENINKVLLYERWAIFSTFYIYLDRRMIEKSKFIKSFANCVFQNMLLCFMLFKIEIMSLGSSQMKVGLIAGSNYRVQKEFQEQFEGKIKKSNKMSINKLDRKNILFFIGKNCAAIHNLLNQISKITNFKIKNGIMGLNSNLKTSLDGNLKFLLDTFCDYFLDKGIVSVEYTDTPTKTSILSVPFVKEPPRNREYTLVLGNTFLS